LTGRLFRILHGLHDDGQAWGSMLAWVGLLVFCAASPISIAATNIAWGVALAGLLVQALSRDDRFASLVRRTDLDAPLACFVLASLLAVLHSLDIESSIVESRSLGLMVIFFLFAWQVQAPAQRRTLVRILIVSSCVSALYGWVQFLTGWDLLGHYRPEAKKVCGFLGLHLTYGEHLSMVICLGLGLLLWVDAKRPARIGSVLALGLMASAVLLSGSKGALLGLVVGLGVVFALRGRKAFLLYAVGGILFCIAMDILMGHRLWGNLVALFQIDAQQKLGPAASNAHRLCMWWAGLWISLDHFLYGVGPHAVEQIYPAFRHPLAIEPNQWHLHNNFVHLGVTRGMLGLAAFLYIFLRVFRLGSYRARVEGGAFDRGLAVGVLGAAAAFLVAGFTEYNWGDSEVLMLLYMLLGLLASCGRQEGATPALKALQANTSITGRTAWDGIGRMSRTLLFLVLAAGLCSLAFLFVPAVQTLRMCVWQACLGIFLLVLALQGWNRLGEAAPGAGPGGAGRGPCVGYHFTRGVWSGRQWVGSSQWLVWVGLAGFAVLFAGLLVKVYRNEKSPVRLVDLAGIGALWTWSAIALVTYGLLRMAAWREPLWGPPYIPLLLLTMLSAILYSAFRFAYSGARVERALLVALGLCTLVHIFR
jgi:putative inorganic carbon (HCO3(-)) transporter